VGNLSLAVESPMMITAIVIVHISEAHPSSLLMDLVAPW